MKKSFICSCFTALLIVGCNTKEFKDEKISTNADTAATTLAINTALRRPSIALTRIWIENNKSEGKRGGLHSRLGKTNDHEGNLLNY